MLGDVYRLRISDILSIDRDIRLILHLLLLLQRVISDNHGRAGDCSLCSTVASIVMIYSAS